MLLRMSPYLVKFVDSWLRERKFKVRLNNIFSDEFSTSEGLPQGSPLSVGLWRIYVADFHVPDSNCQAFMDDIIFWESGNSYEEVMESMREKASALDLWLNNHQMRLNEKKSKLLINKLPDRIQPLIVQSCHYYPQKRLRYVGVNLVTHDNGPDFFLDLKDVKPDLKRNAVYCTRHLSGSQAEIVYYLKSQ